MSAATPAMYLGARQQQHVVGRGANGIRQRAMEARPAALAVDLGLRREHGKLATRAHEGALPLLLVQRARAGSLGAAQPQHVVLRLAEEGAPLAVALLDFERAGGLHAPGLQPT